MGMQLWLGEDGSGVCHMPDPVPKPEELLPVPGMTMPGSTLSSLLPEILKSPSLITLSLEYGQHLIAEPFMKGVGPEVPPQPPRALH